MQNELEKTTCKRCGRKLRSRESISVGMGPTCWRKFINSNNHKKLFDEVTYEKSTNNGVKGNKD